MSFSLPRVCRQRRKLGRHLCTSGRPDGLCGVGGHLRRPRGGLGCIGAGEWTCGCGGQAAHTSSRDITKLRKYQESARWFFFWAADVVVVATCVVTVGVVVAVVVAVGVDVEVATCVLAVGVVSAVVVVVVVGVNVVAQRRCRSWRS